MARIAKPNVQAFRVTLTEYERGWGQKPWDDIYFDNEAEARQYAIDYNKEHNNLDSAPDWYVRADYAGAVK
jgi:hypothetical protein